MSEREKRAELKRKLDWNCSLFAAARSWADHYMAEVDLQKFSYLSGLEEAYLAGVQIASEWRYIPDDGYPAVEEHVLLVWRDEVVKGCYAPEDGINYGYHWDIDGRAFSGCDTDIQYWMPMPAVPKLQLTRRKKSNQLNNSVDDKESK